MIQTEIGEFVEALHQRAASGHTISNYRRDLTRLDTFMDSRDIGLKAVDHIFLRDFLNSLYLDNLEKSSVSRILSAIRSFFRFLVRRQKVSRNPAELVSSPRLPKKLPPKLSESEVQDLLEIPKERHSRASGTGPYWNFSTPAAFG